MIKINTDA